MPALSPTMDTGTIASWALKEGDSFSAGDVLCSIETDKASVDYEVQDDGFLAKILRQGANAVDLKIGTPICVITEAKEDVPAFANYSVDDKDAQGNATEAAPPAATSSTAQQAPVTVPSPLGTYVLMPSARHLAESKGLDATVLAPGSGKDGRVTKGDVLQAIAKNALPTLAVKQQATSHSTAPADSPTNAPAQSAAVPAAAPLSLGDLIAHEIVTEGSHEDVANSKMRKIIAKRLTESKREVPHFYTSFNVALDNVLRLRKTLAKDHEIKVSVNDFVIRCCALALRDVPEVNGTLSSSDGCVKYLDTIDISVAVATPTGLITPILFNANHKGLAEIAETVKDLATRARDGKLAPHEYQGGTFSISNLGMFGISEFSAVINPPQAAILAVGGGARTLVPTPYKENGDGKASPPSIATLLTARLSADRRVVDEATAALFGQAFTHYMNQPQLLLL
ncbi:hypothetical protein ACA910_017751 [Epithemia clementina (nom. ined.)]